VNDDGTLNLEGNPRLIITLKPTTLSLSTAIEHRSDLVYDSITKDEDISTGYWKQKYEVVLVDTDSLNVYDTGTYYWLGDSTSLTAVKSGSDAYAVEATNTWAYKSGSKTWTLSCTPGREVTFSTNVDLKSGDGASMTVALRPVVGSDVTIGSFTYAKTVVNNKTVLNTAGYYQESAQFKTALDRTALALPAYVGTGVDGTGLYMTVSMTGVSMTIEEQSNIRSHSIVSWKDMCPPTVTQADFFLSWLKLFGLYLRPDDGAETIEIFTRNSFYAESETLDWTGKADLSSDMEITPCYASSKLLKWSLKEGSDMLSKSYLEDNGRQYGSTTLDTGYEFGDTSTDVYSSTVFTNAVSAQLKLYKITGLTGPDTAESWTLSEFTDPDMKVCNYSQGSDGTHEPVDATFQLVFRNPTKSSNTHSYIITDDTTEQTSAGEYMHLMPVSTMAAW